ncbi:uncharacterized protein LOC114943325 [Nylanderia fulva]|uniref:uncharacterized protein LOC114943325 n=1 Tax=Nylanderia fulva TaxID=613905 RepID=UPI0010FB07E9|nr:uncharacterized protein LOC114943325 [Nylanderia fulva]
MKNRKKWILENLPTIDEIFDQFPRLADYSGQMIDEEFDRLYSGACDNFLTKFSTYYVPRILTYCNTVRQDLYRVSNFIEEENLRAILLLAYLLPVSNLLRKGKGKKRVKDVTDNVTLTPSINSPIIALDLLFKVHYVLNVTYPTTLLNFFSFLENYCFKISSKKAHAFVSSTHINICNTTPISNVIDNTSDT